MNPAKTCLVPVLFLLSETPLISAEKTMLRGQLEEGGNIICMASSGKSAPIASAEEMVVVDEVANHLIDSAYNFTWDADGVLFRGTVPPASKQDGKAVARVRRQKWNTFRPIGESKIGGVGVTAVGRGDETFTAQRWIVQAQQGKAISGKSLYGILMTGAKEADVLVTCRSKIVDKGSGRYAYTYTVTNSSKSAIDFEWAGIKETIEAGKSFERSIESQKLTQEVSGSAKIVFKDNSKYTITANYWKAPSGGG